ncbi:hypothetical protein BZA05DRAFT_418108 [Tricharina praecox]|uniref:uncharacterized protein n=1 Tax=Tricharina praecox TaxID=43433 RepID=UPI00221EB3E7|nr:uncharacterized protein BZA05DRAFT_418108 [Tricharina praecox]KAI5853295.1 hypothetical protein BZA05DRAFT_418108 [Tricharina praecox]
MYQVEAGYQELAPGGKREGPFDPAVVLSSCRSVGRSVALQEGMEGPGKKKKKRRNRRKRRRYRSCKGGARRGGARRGGYKIITTIIIRISISIIIIITITIIIIAPYGSAIHGSAVGDHGLGGSASMTKGSVDPDAIRTGSGRDGETSTTSEERGAADGCLAIPDIRYLESGGLRGDKCRESGVWTDDAASLLKANRLYGTNKIPVAWVLGPGWIVSSWIGA